MSFEVALVFVTAGPAAFGGEIIYRGTMIEVLPGGSGALAVCWLPMRVPAHGTKGLWQRPARGAATRWPDPCSQSKPRSFLFS